MTATLIVAAFSSCELERPAEGYDLPQIPEALTVNAFLRRGDTVNSIHVTRSSSLSYNQWLPGHEHRQRSFDFYPLTDAEVTLEDLTVGRAVRVPYDAKAKQFTVRDTLMAIMATHEYRVSVSASGLNSVSGQCMVPTATPVTIKADRKSETHVEYTITVPESPKRFFILRETVSHYYYTSFGNNAFSSAQAVDGVVRFVGRALTDYYKTDPTIAMKAELYEFDEAAYKFLLELEQQDATQDNPFASPVFVGGNVRNGYGIVGGVALIDSVRVQ